MIVTHQALIESGLLVPYKAYVPWGVDVRQVDVNPDSGEYVESQLDNVCRPLVGRFVEAGHEHCDARYMVVCASSVKHSQELAEAYSQGDGTLTCPRRTFIHIDADTPPQERKDAFAGFRGGDVDGLTHYAVLETGIDIPQILGMQLARAYKSLRSFLQACGRGARPSHGKEHFTLIDHGYNLAEHGDPQADRPWTLDLRRPTPEEDAEFKPTQKRCPRCKRLYPKQLDICPSCGETKVSEAREIMTVDGTLVEYIPPKPKEPRARRLADEQMAFEKLYFPCSKSKSNRPMTFKSMVRLFHKKNPHLRVRAHNGQTVVCNKDTGVVVSLGYVPPPGSALWDAHVRSVPREELQQTVYQQRGE